MSTHSQRGRVAKKKRGSSIGIFYVVLAIVAIVGVALLATAYQRSSADTSGRPSIATTVALDTLPARGKADAPVTVVEYADFQCPAWAFCDHGGGWDCERLYRYRQSAFRVPRFPRYRSTPTRSRRPRQLAALLTQGAFWPYHDLLYAKQAEWENSPQPLALFAAYAEQLKLDRGKFEASFNSHTHLATITQLYQDSATAG